MWDKRFQMDEFFGELYRSFWRGDKIFPFQCAHWKILLGKCSLNPWGSFSLGTEFWYQNGSPLEPI
jgi:hypothetical protein